MADCIHHDICGLPDDYDEAVRLCILHSEKPDKDPGDFDEALETQQIQNGNIFRYMVFPEAADFRSATFKGTAIFKSANLVGATLENPCLKGANFDYAHLEGATLVQANRSGVCARYAIVDGETLIGDCKTDKKTDFEGVGLDSARIDSRLKARLKCNIRRNHWKKWYVEKPIRRYLLQWPVRLFWWGSDYGS